MYLPTFFVVSLGSLTSRSFDLSSCTLLRMLAVMTALPFSLQFHHSSSQNSAGHFCWCCQWNSGFPSWPIPSDFGAQ